MCFKHQEHIDKLSTKPQEMLAFRFVFEPNDERAINNFKPVLIITPQRNLKPETEATRCQGYALSLFDTRENAENRYLKLTKKRKKLRDSLGTHIAAGAIDKTDGVVSKIDDNGHLSEQLIGFKLDKFPLSLRSIVHLEYFDGPLLSLFENEYGDSYLYSWCDVDNLYNRWLVFRVAQRDKFHFTS
ncbi:MAG: hypothetical protein EAZ23_06010 [Oscillatoriales cyanobacterium]|nr:MAG: hypothetical protein EAZ23_06010 [Oscillatoriales cyanobacterium]